MASSFTLEGVCDTMLPVMEQYLLSAQDLTPWEPPPVWHKLPPRPDSEMQRVKTLEMLRMSGSTQQYYFPDMLLYSLGELENLDPEYASRRERFVSGDEHIFLCNASGTGKTRLLFEVLALHWGLFFTCSWSDLYGSSDLEALLDNIPGTPLLSMDGSFKMTLNVSNPDSPSLHLDVRRNRIITTHYLRSLILARLIVLDHYCALIDKHKIDECVARKKWLYMQVRPHSVLNSDEFVGLSSLAYLLSEDELANRIHKLSSAHRSKLGFVAIDEAQVALNLLPKSFTRTNGEYAPVFLELISIVADLLPSSRLIASGTEYGLDLMQEGIDKSNSRQKGVRFFHDLGSFRSQESVHAYMTHFLGPETSERYSSLAFKWFRGRHRFMALLVACTLMAGDAQFETVLDTLVFKLTEYRRSSSSIIDQIPIVTAVTDKRFDVFSHPIVLRDAIVAFAGNKPFISSTAVHELVTLGAAQYCSDPAKGVIFEPLLLLSICRWLMRYEKFSIHSLFRLRLTDESVDIRNEWFLRGLAACMAKFINLPHSTLGDYLRFAGQEPQWLDEPSELVLPHQNRLGKLDFRALGAQGTLVQVSQDANDVLKWFQSAESPFLIPDPSFGVDMIFFLRFHTNVALACVHVPLARASRRIKQHTPTDPDCFYRSMPHVGKTVRGVLRKLPTLPIPTLSARRTKAARYSVIRILCFADPIRSGDIHNPPIAALRFPRLLQEPSPPVMEFSHLVSIF